MAGASNDGNRTEACLRLRDTLGGIGVQPEWQKLGGMGETGL